MSRATTIAQGDSQSDLPVAVRPELLQAREVRGKPLPQAPTIGIFGVPANSRLGQSLAEGLSGIAQVVPTGGVFDPNLLWRRMVRGTALDWSPTSSVAASGNSTQPDIILDLHGGDPGDRIRTWRIVDAFGACILRPFSCLANSPNASLVTSLFLVEKQDNRSEWTVLAEAHISSRRSSRNLLDAIGRTAVWLVKAGLHASPLSATRARSVAPGTPARAAAVVSSRLASARAWIRDHACTEIWAIGKLAEPVQAFLQTRTVESTDWIEIPARDGFVADPFAWPGREGVILYERYSHRTGLGSIEVSVMDEQGVRRTSELDLKIRTHLSYPFTFADGQRVLCLPEMGAEGRLVIYVIDPNEAPRELCVVAENVAMADPTLFQHGGLYWIAYSDEALGSHENLCLLYADRIEGPWRPHKLNPVKLDVRSARPAGPPFSVDGMLFRPAQDCSRSYGNAVVINRIVECTPTSYQEVSVATLTPNPQGRYPHGLHTFTVTQAGILLDGKRIAFDPIIIALRLVRRARKLLGRTAGKP